MFPAWNHVAAGRSIEKAIGAATDNARIQAHTARDIFGSTKRGVSGETTVSGLVCDDFSAIRGW
ncbi:hypothetical protein JCM19992_06840 [Thermostilla marina]